VTKVALRGLLGRRLRTFLTALAVVLGVAMVAGSYVLTDTLLDAASALESTSYDRVDAAVAAKQAFKPSSDNGSPELKPVPESLVAKVRAVPQVQVASGEISDQAQLIGRDGKVIGGSGGPTFATGYDTSNPELTGLSPFELKSGRFPQKRGQIAIDASTAEDKHYKPGDTIKVAARGPAQPFEVSGVVTFGNVKSIGNATLAVFTLREAQALFKREGKVDTILVRGRKDVSKKQLVSALKAAMPPSVTVESAKSQDRFDIGGLKDFLNILQKILLGFGAVSVFVGAFIIFNTLSITVAQRTKEFALLRTLGASRRQVLRSVVLEAVVIGLLASVIGILVGIGLAKGLNALFEAVGADLPKTSTVLKSRTIIVALIVGVGVTVAAGLSPALQATRVAPVEALREGMATRKRSRWAPYVAAGTTVIGVILLSYGMFAGGLDIGARLASIGLGCLVLFFGVALLSQRVVRPLASVLGRPAQRIGGAAGRLARENSMRNPSRTATTAAALMIGLALVTFVAILGQGLRSSYGASLDKQLDANYVLTAEDDFSPFAPEAARAAASAPGVTAAAQLREDQVKAFGDKTTIDGVDPTTWSRVYKFNFTKGSATALRTPERPAAVVTKQFADDHKLTLLKSFRTISPNGSRLELLVTGIDDRPQFNPLGLAKITISDSLFRANFTTTRPRYAFIDMSGGTSPGNAGKLKQALAPFPGTKLRTQAKFKKDSEAQITQTLSILYVMLALSVIVSLVGIVNTLVLSVFERTRELGMLRAIGMTRRQVRRMVRHEAVIVALIGAVLGIAVGFFLSALVVGALSSEGVVFAVPVGTLIAFLIVAILAGMAAAILPARRAARLNVLEALQYE
jgi:putative ABC transport system permease protein